MADPVSGVLLTVASWVLHPVSMLARSAGLSLVYVYALSGFDVVFWAGLLLALGSRRSVAYRALAGLLMAVLLLAAVAAAGVTVAGAAR